MNGKEKLDGFSFFIYEKNIEIYLKNCNTCVIMLFVRKFALWGIQMKKSILALIISLTCVFTACDFSGILPGSTDSTVNSSSDSSADTSFDSSSSLGGNDSEEHRDRNNDETCDDCGISVVETFDIFGVNDLHGKFADSDTQPGVDELTTYLKNAKASNENTVFLSSGDMWQGSSESNLTKGLIVTDWMSEMGFSAMTLGNHEYDWGVEYVESNAEIANFPFLALNIYDNATNRLVDYCQPSVLVEQGSVRIGIIGAIGDCYSSISGDKVEGVHFKTGSDLTALVKAEANKLRSQGADFIVYSLHDGYGSSMSGSISDSMLSSYYDISLSDCVDLVFEGHTHQRYVLKDSKGVYHLQDGGDNDGISHVQVKINFANEQSTVQKAEFVSTSAYSSLADDPIVNDLLAKYNDEIVKAGRVLGNNDKMRNSTEILQKVADLYYEAGLERWGEEYDIVLGGGFMSARSPYNVYAGEVLYGDLMSVLPFDNQLVLCSISGAKLRSQFFETDNNRYYISYGEYGATVKSNIVASKTYYVVTDTYSSQYAPNGMTEIARYDETTFARDLLADFIANGGWGQPAGEITLTSIPEILALGATLAKDEETSKIYYVQGEIVSITSPEKYGNMTIKDENGNTLYIYGTWDKSGANRYGNMANPPQVGDKVVLVGTIKNYNGTQIEMIDGRFYEILWLPE